MSACYHLLLLKTLRHRRTSSHTAVMCGSIFASNWVLTYFKPDYILTDSGSQMFSQFFAGLCPAPGTTYVEITSYHLHINGQTEQYSRTLSMHPHYYVANNPEMRLITLKPSRMPTKPKYTALSAFPSSSSRSSSIYRDNISTAAATSAPTDSDNLNSRTPHLYTLQ